jgi:hypothetical protein
MYSNKLTVALKHNGKILRERSGYVSLPFGSEYSLLVKNLNTRKVSINISIDSEDVLNNKSLLVYPNSETELKGFMDGMTARNKFKFIQKTKEISDYRGDRIDDGLIRIEFAFEKEKPEIIHHHHKHHHVNDDWYWPYRPYRYRGVTWSNSVDCSFTSDSDVTGAMESSTLYGSNSFNDDGITVKGSEINQDFNYGSIDELGQSHVIIIKLRGEKNNGTVIRKPITVKTKLVCPTCGKRSRSDLKYCSTCGTFLK